MSAPDEVDELVAVAARYGNAENGKVAFLIVADVSGIVAAIRAGAGDYEGDLAIDCGYHGPPWLRLAILKKLVFDFEAEEEAACAERAHDAARKGASS